MERIYTKNWNRKKNEESEISNGLVKKIIALLTVGTIFLTTQYFSKDSRIEKGVFRGYHNDRQDYERVYVFDIKNGKNKIEKVFPGNWELLDSFYRAVNDSQITGRNYIIKIDKRGWPFGERLTSIRLDNLKNYK